MEIIEYRKECSLCAKPGIFELKWKDGSVLYLCKEHFHELRICLIEREEDP